MFEDFKEDFKEELDGVVAMGLHEFPLPEIHFYEVPAGGEPWGIDGASSLFMFSTIEEAVEALRSVGHNRFIVNFTPFNKVVSDEILTESIEDLLLE